MRNQALAQAENSSIEQTNMAQSQKKLQTEGELEKLRLATERRDAVRMGRDLPSPA